MEFKVYAPHALLRPFVRSIWTVNGKGRQPQEVVCDGHSELIFHFGDAYSIKKADGWEKQAACLAAGQLQGPILLKPEGTSGILGVKFAATGLWRLFGWNMSSLTNDVLPLQQLMAGVQTLQWKIAEAADDAQRISSVEDILLRRLKSIVRTPCLDPVIARIVAHDGAASVSMVAKEFKISLRRLERMFHEQVGIPPKLYSRIVRFRKVYDMLQQPHLNTAEISHLCGYFDQPHLDKDFKYFAGQNPQKYFSGDHTLAKFLLKANAV